LKNTDPVQGKEGEPINSIGEPPSRRIAERKAHLAPQPRPVRSYAEADQRIQALRANAPSGMTPDCQIQLLSHERRVTRAIVFVHGYTSCPKQFRSLGERFFDLGYNVLIAPLPDHGLANRLTEAHARLTAEELVAYADEVVDIVQGLGEYRIMAGLSLGGAITGWAAQNRTDLDLAVPISPGFSFHQIPTRLTRLAMYLLGLLPNIYQWWDPTLKDAIGPQHAYPRYASRALAQILRLGLAVETRSAQAPPAAHSIILVTNANDFTVNNQLARRILANWLAHGGQVASYEFPASLNLGHDFIDPAQPDQRTDIVYPRLLDLIDELPNNKPIN
jgi:esterase/lipase